MVWSAYPYGPQDIPNIVIVTLVWPEGMYSVAQVMDTGLRSAVKL